MKKIIPILCFVLLLIHLHGQSLPGYKRVSLPVGTKEMNMLRQADVLPAHYHLKNGQLEMELDPAEYMAFVQLKLPFREISFPAVNDDVTDLIQQRQQTASVPLNFSYGSMGGYYTYAEAMAILDDMRVKYPTLISGKDTIGFTFEGRPIVAVRISDNPDNDEAGEDEWLMTSLHHANEVMGMSVVFYYAWYLLEHYGDDPVIRKLLNNSALYIIPVVNPDGLAFNESTNPSGGGTWRKNRKPRVIGATTHYGVDLNRNYGYKWGYTHAGQLGQAGSNFAGNSYYRGTAAWSEQETSSMRNFCEAHHFTAAFNYHAWDDSFNYPWNFDIDSLTPDKNVFSAIAQYCTADNLFEYGTFNQTLGYTANGTSDDWLYGEQASKGKIYAFTIEVGKSFYPAQSLIIPYCDSLLQANLKMLKMAAAYAEVTETSSNSITSFTSQVEFSIKRFSIQDSDFTVSVQPLNLPDVPINVTGPAVVYSDLNFLEQRSGGTISYEVPPTTPNGTNVRFLLTVSNGKWTISDTISKIFMGHSVLALGCENSTEPNDVPAQAKPIYPGARTYAAIEQLTDHDWFRFTTTAEQRNIRVILSGLPADFDMELRDPNGMVVAIADNSYKIADTIVYNGGKEGVYTLHVYGYHKAFHAQQCYSLDLNLQAALFSPVYSSGFKQRENKPGASFSVSPIPATHFLQVQAKMYYASAVNWTISDNTGRKLKEGRVQLGTGIQFFQVMIGDLPKGYYILNLLPVTGAVPATGYKIIKE